MLRLEMTGDWNRAGIHLKNIAASLNPTFQAKFLEDGQLILEKMQDHIYSQDLGWTPLSKHTIELKGGDTTIMIETGKLVNGLTVRRIKSSNKGAVIYVGASPWKTHSDGTKMSDLMIWLEYGTDSMPPRPLIRPTFDEVKDLLQKNWEEIFKDIVEP